MTETQLLDIIKHARQNFWETQQKFSKRAEILELTANTTSLSLNDFGKARELIARGVEITKDYFVACEAIIFSLDDAARPMLAQLSAQTVGHLLSSLFPPPAAVASPPASYARRSHNPDGSCEACRHNQKENPIRMDGVSFWYEWR